MTDTAVPHRARGAFRRRRSPSRAGRWAQAFEVLFLILLFFPITALAVLVTGGRAAVGGSFAHLAVALIVRDIALVAVVALFLRRRREPARAIGWTGRRWGREVLLGFGLYFVMLLILSVVVSVLTRAGVPARPELPAAFSPSTGPEIALALALVVVVAITEEILFRGYLLLRLRNVTRSAPAAVVLSSVLFALGHGYEGAVGMIAVGVLGAFLAVIYLWRGSLVAPIVMHFCQDFIGLVLLPAIRVANPEGA